MCAHMRVHMSFDSWESAPLVVMETVGTVCMCVRFAGETPKIEQGAGLVGRTGATFRPLSRCLHFFYVRMSVSVSSSETSAALV